MLPLSAPATAGYGLVLGLIAHFAGWPMVEGGSQRLADALVQILVAGGGEIVTGTEVRSLGELPSARAILLDVSPRQLLRMAADDLPPRYARALDRYRYGPGVFKLDWALDAPIPWSDPATARAATVHVGGTLEEIAAGEAAVNHGAFVERPFTLVVQPTVFDPSRAPAGKHTAWAYCHVPNGSSVDVTDAVERNIERFAPGFRDRVLDRHVMGPAAMEAHDANYVGGDIAVGAADLRQIIARPVASLHPWVTPVPGVFLCSSATPPGPGTHGMCGWHAARAALRRHG
jgi:phytoene dehydrogenase-like protein